MLTSDDYWCVLWDVLRRANGDEGALKSILQALPKQTIIDFYKEFRRAMLNLYDIQYGASEDNQRAISALIVSEGKEFYDEIILHPERVPSAIDPDGPYFLDVPGQVVWEQFGEDINDL